MIVGGRANVGAANLIIQPQPTCHPWRRITHSVEKAK